LIINNYFNNAHLNKLQQTYNVKDAFLKKAISIMRVETDTWVILDFQGDRREYYYLQGCLMQTIQNVST